MRAFIHHPRVVATILFGWLLHFVVITPVSLFVLPGLHGTLAAIFAQEFSSAFALWAVLVTVAVAANVLTVFVIIGCIFGVSLLTHEPMPARRLLCIGAGCFLAMFLFQALLLFTPLRTVLPPPAVFIGGPLFQLTGIFLGLFAYGAYSRA